METKLPSISREQLLRRVRGEYLEMPGLKLSCLQAQRLWAMDEQTCAEILNSLTEARFLSGSLTAPMAASWMVPRRFLRREWPGRNVHIDQRGQPAPQ